MRFSVLFGVGLLMGCTSSQVLPDAGADGATTVDAQYADAAVDDDAGAPCDNDAACDDGLFCNGEETCTAGQCAAGEAPSCDDDIECTADSCSESLRECVNEPPDADADGVADAACLGVDGLPLGEDCDDADANRFPGNPEVCDAEDHDEDCNFETYGAIDVDVDRHDDADCCNVDDAGVSHCGDDCDDSLAQVYSGALELCDDLDNDCDEVVDEELTELTFGRDCDADNFGVAPETTIVDCALPVMDVGCAGGRWVPDVTDCDDTEPLRNPGLVEVCDGLDNDCANGADDGLVFLNYWPDCDADTQGDKTAEPLLVCTPPAAPACDGGAYVLNGSDCDDTSSLAALGLSEVCDDVDNDCDTEVDEEIAQFEHWPDCDGDGEGDDLASPVLACGTPEDDVGCAGGVWVRNDEDCDDTDVLVNHDATEVCDYVDNDCNGTIDIGLDDMSLRVAGRFDRDADGAGGSVGQVHCVGHPNFVPGTPAVDDCDDTNPDVFPDQTEYFEDPTSAECMDGTYDTLCADGLTCGRTKTLSGLPPLMVNTCYWAEGDGSFDTRPAELIWNYDCNNTHDRPSSGICTCSPPFGTPACHDTFNYPDGAACGEPTDYFLCTPAAGICGAHPALRVCNTTVTREILPCR